MKTTYSIVQYIRPDIVPRDPVAVVARDEGGGGKYKLAVSQSVKRVATASFCSSSFAHSRSRRPPMTLHPLFSFR